jgi:hypothetical protein
MMLLIEYSRVGMGVVLRKALLGGYALVALGSKAKEKYHSLARKIFLKIIGY